MRTRCSGEAEYFAGIPDIALPDEMLQIAEHIMQAKTGDFDPAILEDRYRTALVEILRTKKREMPIADGPVQPSSQNVINLMDALRRSMESERPAVAKPPPRRAASKPARRVEHARSKRQLAYRVPVSGRGLVGSKVVLRRRSTRPSRPSRRDLAARAIPDRLP